MDKYHLDELQATLSELNKAVDNIEHLYQAANALGLFSLFRSGSGESIPLMDLVKRIDFKQISLFLQSPLVRQLLSDPEFYQLFSGEAHSMTATQPDPNKHSAQTAHHVM